jgi:hypothetical protein
MDCCPSSSAKASKEIRSAAFLSGLYLFISLLTTSSIEQLTPRQVPEPLTNHQLDMLHIDLRRC